MDKRDDRKRKKIFIKSNLEYDMENFLYNKEAL